MLNQDAARINVSEAFTDLVSQINNKLPQQKPFQQPNNNSGICCSSCNIL